MKCTEMACDFYWKCPLFLSFNQMLGKTVPYVLMNLLKAILENLLCLHN